MDLQELVLMSETQARRLLRGQRLLMRVLAPVGAYAGRGTLRVLRLRPAGPSSGSEQAIELVCGYEAYEAFERPGTSLRPAQDSGRKA